MNEVIKMYVVLAVRTKKIHFVHSWILKLRKVLKNPKEEAEFGQFLVETQYREVSFESDIFKALKTAVEEF